MFGTLAALATAGVLVTAEADAASSPNWGLMANADNAASGMQAVYFYPGDLMPDVQSLYFVLNPQLSSQDLHADENMSPIIQRMKAENIHVVVATYHGVHNMSYRSYNETLDSTDATWQAAQAAEMHVMPALESGYDCPNDDFTDRSNCVPNTLQPQCGVNDQNICAACPDGTTGTFYSFETDMATWGEYGTSGASGYGPQTYRVISDLLSRYATPQYGDTWAKMYDSSGTSRYAVNIDHANVMNSPLAELTDEQFTTRLDGLANAIGTAAGVLLGFTLDAWQCSYISGAGATIPLEYNLNPATSPSALSSSVSFLGIQSFFSEAQFNYPVAMFINDLYPPFSSSTLNFDTLGWLGELANGRHLGDTIGWRNWINSWVSQGIPTIMDVDSGYYAGKVFPGSTKNPEMIHGDYGADTSDGGADTSDGGACSSDGDAGACDGGHVVDDWRNVMAEMKGSGIKGVQYNAWNDFTEGLVAVPTNELGSVEPNWLTDFFAFDPAKYCDIQYYEGGARTWHVYGAICQKYNGVGGHFGVLGAPTGNAGNIGGPDAAAEQFANGRIYWDSTGAHEVHGGIYAEYAATGYDAGILGFPRSDETVCPDGWGRFNTFWNSGESPNAWGAIYWTPQYSGHALWGPIYAAWAARGWEQSGLGYPTAEIEGSGPDGREFATFECGYIDLAVDGKITVVQTPGCVTHDGN
jgi:hypothetical protein